MEITKKHWLGILVASVKKFSDENTIRDCAAIAFYTIFSLPGIAIISVMIASSFFYEHEQVKNELLKDITLLMGKSSEKQINQIISSPILSNESLLMKILGPIILIVSTTTVFISMQESLNKIWKVKAKPKKVVLKFFIDRLISLEFVASLGFIIIVSLTMDTMAAMLKVAMSDYIKNYSIYIVLVLNSIFSIAVSILVFASIYKVLPDLEIKWKDVWLGAIVTTVLFTIGKYLIAYYLDTNNFDNAYGAAGSLVAMLFWVYFTVIILLLGAQFTAVYAQHQGKKIKPNKYAVAIEIVEVAKKEGMN